MSIIIIISEDGHMTRGKSLVPGGTGRCEPIGSAVGHCPVSFESELVFPQARHSLPLQVTREASERLLDQEAGNPTGDSDAAKRR